jgi:hypothetical protein
MQQIRTAAAAARRVDKSSRPARGATKRAGRGAARAATNGAGMAATNGTSPDDPAENPIEGLRARADMLFRAAAECLHQHDRYSRFVEHEVLEGEQKGAQQLVRLCDEMLAGAVASYEKWCHLRPDGDAPWWRAANTLWMAAREFGRRCDCSDRTARRGGNTARDFAQLACDFDLEASALLGLRVAVDAYRKSRPEAALAGVTPKN